jgi:signal transduction histidine kinase
VSGDAARLRQVFWSLLSNAVKFTPPGGTVRVEVRQHGGAAEIVVADTGAGMEREFLARVFSRFSRADASSTRPTRGLGLGLSLARGLVELHGGDLLAESPGLGRGSTFTVRLPLIPADPADPGRGGSGGRTTMAAAGEAATAPAPAGGMA